MPSKGLRVVRAQRAAVSAERIAEATRQVNAIVPPALRADRRAIEEAALRSEVEMDPRGHRKRDDETLAEWRARLKADGVVFRSANFTPRFKLPPEPEPGPEADWFKKIKAAGGVMLTLIAERGPQKTYALINGRRIPKTTAEWLINCGYLIAQPDSLLPDGQPQTWVPRGTP